MTVLNRIRYLAKCCYGTGIPGPGPNLKKIKAEARAEMLFPDAADAAAPTARAPLFRPCDRLHAAF